VSAEQALKSLITSHIEEKREEFLKEEPGYHLTITISGEPTYSKELLEHLKP
jgi:wyosine [tRNA(Phe)-imidazoG37] synthetase (radical SAM superfamily)